MNVEERMRIADDLHRMAYRLMERTLWLWSESQLVGSGEDDAELRMLYEEFAGLTRDWLTKYPQESRVRTEDSGYNSSTSEWAGSAQTPQPRQQSLGATDAD